MMYCVRGQIKNMGDRTRVLYTTTDLAKAKEYETKLKNRDDVVMTIITRRA
jgi:hypothetical protein